MLVTNWEQQIAHNHPKCLNRKDMAPGGHGHATPTHKSFPENQSPTFLWLSLWLLWRRGACLNHIWSIQHNLTKADATNPTDVGKLKEAKMTRFSSCLETLQSYWFFKRSIFVLEGLVGRIRTEFSVLVYCRCQQSCSLEVFWKIHNILANVFIVNESNAFLLWLFPWLQCWCWKFKENKALVIMLVKDFKLTKSSVLIPGQLIKVDQVRQK